MQGCIALHVAAGKSLQATPDKSFGAQGERGIRVSFQNIVAIATQIQNHAQINPSLIALNLKITENPQKQEKT